MAYRPPNRGVPMPLLIVLVVAGGLVAAALGGVAVYYAKHAKARTTVAVQPAGKPAPVPPRSPRTDDDDGFPILTPLVTFVLALGIIPATIAHRKGHNFFLWWFLSCVGGFVFVVPFAIILKPNNTALEERELSGGKRKCPDCAELVNDEARKCRHCGYVFRRKRRREPDDDED